MAQALGEFGEVAFEVGEIEHRVVTVVCSERTSAGLAAHRF
jgi:hypothetical protein